MALLPRSFHTRRLVLLVVVLCMIFLFLRSPSIPTSRPKVLLEPPEKQYVQDEVGNPHQQSKELEDDAKDHPEHPKSPGTPRSRVSEDMQKLLKWDAPKEIKAHYPPYSDYDDRDHDPNRWEAFEQNQAFYYNGSIDQIPSKPTGPLPYNPYPGYTSSTYQSQHRVKVSPCEGSGGSILVPGAAGTVSAYLGVPNGFPEPDSGSYEAVGLDKDVCFDRYSRLGVYGLNADTDFSKTRWFDLQNKCVELNKDRFVDSTIPKIGPGSSTSLDEKRTSVTNTDVSYTRRTAILIRTWDAYDYRENDIQAIRSMITELNLLSGGEYHVFLFVNVKDASLPIFTDRAVHDDLLKKYVPEELRDIAILWTEAICNTWYPNVGMWEVYFQQWMPLQWFSQTHPEFEYIWNWEMDARYIGNHYHFLEGVASFSKKQPRKHLWELSSRYYFPRVHGSYENFTAETRRIVENSPHVQTVWGPQPWSSNQIPQGPTPPHSEASDTYTWGIGEEADFITLLPMWDPRETWWSYRDKLWGYPNSEDSTDERLYPHVPRRTFINTLVRLSKGLLDAMHRENLAGVSMASEMWPSSTALHHGLKAVYAPHPIWFSQIWPDAYMDPIFNADGWGAGSKPGYGSTDDGRGRGFVPEREEASLAQNGTGPNGEGLAGRWGQERDSPYSPDREHNLAGWSWYFWSDFPKVLYWRWLGWKAGFAIVTIEGSSSTDELRDVDWSEWEEKNGRLCYPAMLLHPVKNVQQPTGGTQT